MLRDLIYAFRSMRRTPVPILAAVLTLALGIGAVTTAFSTFNATVLRPLPYPRFQDIYALGTAFPDGGLTVGLVAPAELAPLGDSAPSVLAAAGAAPAELTLIRDEAAPTVIQAYSVTAGFFDVFGLPMAMGSAFTPEHHVRGGAPAVVVSHRIWQSLFAGDPSILGRAIRFSEASDSIVVAGVAPPELDHPPGADVWLSMPGNPQSVIHNLYAYARVRPGTTAGQLQNELDRVMAQVAEQYPATNTDRVFVREPLVEALVGDLRPTLVVVFALTGLLLLLACANVTTLLLARGITRTREIALRTALGATRGRVLRQLLTESAALALVGAVFGMALAWAGTRMLLGFGAAQLPRLSSIPFDGRVLSFALFALGFSALLVGLVPAIRLARTNIRALVNDGGRSASGGRGTFRLLGAITIVEIAVAITLLAGTGWLVRSHDNLLDTDPGFDAEGRIVFELALPFVRYPQPLEATRELLEELRELPGVASVDAASSFPLGPDRDGTWFVEVSGVAYDANRPPIARLRTVSAGFFDTMGIDIVSGRGFSDQDREDSAPVTVVNEEFVQRYLRGQSATATQLAFGYPSIDSSTRRSIVGVVEDVRHLSLSDEAEPAYYLVHGQGAQPYRQSVVVATALADPAQLMPAIREVVRRLDPQLVVEPVPVPSLVAATLARQRFAMSLMLVFGAIALVLAAVGIYGIVAFGTTQRSGEVATRLALGASPRDIFWLLTSQGGRLAIAGAALGLTSAWIGGRLASAWLYEVSASDPAVLAGGAGAVVFIVLCASAVSARRAARLDPAVSLRSQ